MNNKKRTWKTGSLLKGAFLYLCVDDRDNFYKEFTQEQPYNVFWVVEKEVFWKIDVSLLEKDITERTLEILVY